MISTRYIRLGMTNTSPILYCICLVTVLSMLKRLKCAIAVFVSEQSDFIFLYVSAIHARRKICKDYAMNCLSILYKTSLGQTVLFLNRYNKRILLAWFFDNIETTFEFDPGTNYLVTPGFLYRMWPAAIWNIDPWSHTNMIKSSNPLYLLG